MNKKVKTLYIGFMAVIVLAAVMVLLLTFEPTEDQDSDALTSSDAGSVEDDVAFYTLIEEDANTCESIVVKNEYGEYTISKLGEEKWGDEALDGYSLLDDSYTTLVNNLSLIDTNERVLEKVDNLAEYGLDNPRAEAVITFGTNEYTLKIGNETVEGGNYYTMLEGDDALYAISVSTISGLFKSQYEYISKLLIESFDSEDTEAIPDVTTFNVTRNDLDYDIAVEKAPEQTEEEAEFTAVYNTYIMSSPINAEVSSTSAEEFIFTLFGLTANSVVAIDAQDKMEEYGFNAPTCTVDMVYDSRNVNLVVGSKVEGSEDEYYLLYNDNNVVYTVSEASIAVISYDPNDIMSKLAVLPFINSVDKIVLTYEGNEDVFDLEGAEDELTATLNGDALETELFKDFYQLLLSVSIDEMNFVEPEGEPIMSIEYFYRENDLGKETELVEMFLVEDRNMIIKVNGDAYYLGRSAYIDKVLVEFENLKNGNEIDIDW